MTVFQRAGVRNNLHLPLISSMHTAIFWGKVRKGQKRGRDLGFPTANIALHKKISEGIYISHSKIDKHIYQSVTFIGKAETFDEHTYQAETYILGFDKSIYGKYISITLLEKIRDNKKFATVEELISQMHSDIMQAKQYFENRKYV